MKIGILKCDTVRDEFKPRFGDYPDMFVRLLETVDDGLDMDVFDVRHGEYPDNTDSCAAWLVTGSRFGVYDDEDWIAPLGDYLRRLHGEQRRMVGVCFGHQIISHSLGGHAEKSGKGWGVGVANTTLHDKPWWMEPELDELSIVVSHQDQVTRLPPDATVLGSTEFCPNAVVAVAEHILTFQGHPEFDADFSRALMDMRRDIIPAERIAAGMASLTRPIQSQQVARWICHFLRGQPV